MKKVLVIGSSGLIGSYISEKLEQLNYIIYRTTRNASNVSQYYIYIDLNDLSTFNNILEYSFDIVLFAAGISSVATCEAFPKYTEKVNVANTLRLLSSFRNHPHIIYLSSSSVFGDLDFIPDQEITVYPKNIYAKQKLLVEKSLASHCVKLTIIRVSKVIESLQSLFTLWKSSLLKTESISPFHDKYFSPVDLFSLHNVVVFLITTRTFGIFHFSSSFLCISEAPC